MGDGIRSGSAFYAPALHAAIEARRSTESGRLGFLSEGLPVPPESLDTDERVQCARAVMTLLDDWGVAPDQRIVLLGLPAATKPRALTRYRQDTPLPDEPDLLHRVERLLAIQHALEFTFPHNPQMASYWITTDNDWFGGRTPIDIMLTGGLAGIEQVARHLEHDDNW